MITAWLLLFLLPLVQTLGLYGWGPKTAPQLLVLLPLAALPVALGLKARLPGLFAPGLLRAAGLGAAVLGLSFVRTQLLLPVDLKQWAPSLHLAGLGLLGLWVAVGSTQEREGPGHALWAGAWLLAGWLDPALPFLGLGVSAFLRGFDLLPECRTRAFPRDLGPFPVALLLGLALPKPCWDFGHAPSGALGLAAVGLGMALARTFPGFGSRLPRLMPSALLALGFVLYHPAALLPWGLGLGLAAGWALLRTGTSRLGALSGGLLLGLGLSFTLHANAWLPGLRHLIWLGN